MGTDKKPPKINTSKPPETKTWLNNKGQTCRRCEWCPGEMILKGT